MCSRWLCQEDVMCSRWLCQEERERGVAKGVKEVTTDVPLIKQSAEDIRKLVLGQDLGVRRPLYKVYGLRSRTLRQLEVLYTEFIRHFPIPGGSHSPQSLIKLFKNVVEEQYFWDSLSNFTDDVVIPSGALELKPLIFKTIGAFLGPVPSLLINATPAVVLKDDALTDLRFGAIFGPLLYGMLAIVTGSGYIHPAARDAITSHNIFLVGSVQNASVSDEPCPVCLEEYEEGKKYWQLGCGHRFHGDCLGPWLQASGDCPMCRSLVKRKNPLSVRFVSLPNSFRSMMRIGRRGIHK